MKVEVPFNSHTVLSTGALVITGGKHSEATAKFPNILSVISIVDVKVVVAKLAS